MFFGIVTTLSSGLLSCTLHEILNLGHQIQKLYLLHVKEDTFFPTASIFTGKFGSRNLFFWFEADPWRNLA